MYQTELMVWSLVGKVIINKTQVTIICWAYPMPQAMQCILFEICKTLWILVKIFYKWRNWTTEKWIAHVYRTMV